MKINPISPDVRKKRKRKADDDRHYLEWLRKQRSAYSGRGPCVAAHFRTAATAGIACKPLYHAIPLTNNEHMEQHRIGQFKFANREWWEFQVNRYQIIFEMEGGIIPKKYRIKK